MVDILLPMKQLKIDTENIVLGALNELLAHRRTFDDSVKLLTDTALGVIEKFVEQVNFQAETNMMKTGRLEGSHYNAMNRLLQELRAMRHEK
jgi:hypothetical protein